MKPAKKPRVTEEKDNFCGQVFGFLGGTFDPIHYGHLNLALEIFERYELNRVFFCPSNHSPGKTQKPFASPAHRLAMVRLAIEPIPAFSLIDLELQRPGPSYTFETIRRLKAQYPEVHFRLILGEDLLQELANWKEIEQLLQLAPPIIGTRHQKLPPTLLPLPPFLEKIEEGLTLIPLLDISSSEVRERLKKSRYCGHLLPVKVLDYIQQNHLYY